MLRQLSSTSYPNSSDLAPADDLVHRIKKILYEIFRTEKQKNKKKNENKHRYQYINSEWVYFRGYKYHYIIGKVINLFEKVQFLFGHISWEKLYRDVLWCTTTDLKIYQRISHVHLLKWQAVFIFVFPCNLNVKCF